MFPKAIAVPLASLHGPPPSNMPEAPIETIGVIREALPGRVFRVELPNGKLIVGHLPRRLADLAEVLTFSDRVNLELTPYDFEKARIVGRIENPDE